MSETQLKLKGRISETSECVEETNLEVSQHQGLQYSPQNTRGLIVRTPMKWTPSCGSRHKILVKMPQTCLISTPKPFSKGLNPFYRSAKQAGDEPPRYQGRGPVAPSALAWPGGLPPSRGCKATKPPPASGVSHRRDYNDLFLTMGSFRSAYSTSNTPSPKIGTGLLAHVHVPEFTICMRQTMISNVTQN